MVFCLASSSCAMTAAAQIKLMCALLYSCSVVLTLNTCFSALQLCLLKVQCLLQLGYFKRQGSFLSLHQAQLCLQRLFSAVLNRQACAGSTFRMAAAEMQQLGFLTYAVSGYLPLSLVPVGAAVVSLCHLDTAVTFRYPCRTCIASLLQAVPFRSAIFRMRLSRS